MHHYHHKHNFIILMFNIKLHKFKRMSFLPTLRTTIPEIPCKVYCPYTIAGWKLFKRPNNSKERPLRILLRKDINFHIKRMRFRDKLITKWLTEYYNRLLIPCVSLFSIMENSSINQVLSQNATPASPANFTSLPIELYLPFPKFEPV